MAIQFNTVPTTRVPGFYAEFSPRSQPGASALIRPTVIVGQMLSGGTGVAGTQYQITSAAQAAALFGAGSTITSMVAAYRANDPNGELYAIGLADNSEGTAASGTITFEGTTTAAGSFVFWVAGRRVVVDVATGTTAANCALAAETAINAIGTLPVTSSDSAAVLTVTARHKGVIGNDIKIYLDPDAPLPAGAVAPVIVQLSSGAGALAADGTTALGELEVDAIVIAMSDDTTLDAWKAVTDDRWGPTELKFGHVFAGMVDSVTNLAAHGVDRNDPYASILGMVGAFSPTYDIAAAFAGACMVRLRNDPAANLNGVQIKGIRGAAYEDRLTFAESEVLLGNGIATTQMDRSGAVTIERPITTYQRDSTGEDDTAWLDIQTPFSAARFTRRMRARINRVGLGAKLANDGAPIGGGQNVVTPAYLRAEILGEYQQMEIDGLVEDPAGFESDLIVERNVADPTRVDILFPPNWVNQYLITAAQIRFVV